MEAGTLENEVFGAKGEARGRKKLDFGFESNPEEADSDQVPDLEEVDLEEIRSEAKKRVFATMAP